MLFDNDLMFSENQAVTATASGTNVLDCGQAILTPALNGAMNLYAIAIATTDFTGTGTIKVELQDCDTASGTFATVGASAAVVATKFAKAVIPMPLEHRRYLKLVYTVDGTVAAGKITAGITTSLDAQQIFHTEDTTFQ
jgi:hypothetical protein